MVFVIRDFALFSDWFKACQALMAIGLAAGLTALLAATLGLCCECHSCNPNHPVCGLLVIACEYILYNYTIIDYLGIGYDVIWTEEYQYLQRR